MLDDPADGHISFIVHTSQWEKQNQ